MKLVDFHENSGFLLLFLAPAPIPTKKQANSIGFEPPWGAKSANFTHFHENHQFSPILMEFHQNLSISMKKSEIVIFYSPGGLQNL